MCDAVEGSVAKGDADKSRAEGMLMEKDAKKKVKALARWQSRGLELMVQLPLPKLLLRSTSSSLLFIAAIERKQLYYAAQMQLQASFLQSEFKYLRARRNALPQG